MGNDFVAASGGTGDKLTKAVVILAGVGSLVATLISFLFVFSPYLLMHQRTWLISAGQYGCNRRITANLSCNDMSFESS
jgi:hypothetical protein